MALRLSRRTLIAGLEDLFKSVELQLPCVIAVNNFDVHRVVKQLAIALNISHKFWVRRQEDKVGYYTILYNTPISGAEIERLVDEFENRE